MFSNIREGMKQFYPGDYANWLASKPEQASDTPQFARQWAGEEPQAALEDLKQNEKASGRLKDLQDLEELP